MSLTSSVRIAESVSLRMPSAAPIGIELLSVRGTTGYFRVGQVRTGAWWLFSPDGAPCFPAALAGRRLQGPEVPRMRGLGFDTVVVADDGGFALQEIWQVRCACLSDGAPRLRTGGACLPDVFDPGWRGQVAQRAAIRCAPFRDDRRIVAWQSDDTLSWAWASPRGRPTLLQLCLSLEPCFAAYHAAWEFVLALHQGSFDAMVAAWQVDLKNKDALRSWTQEEKGIGSPAYLADHRLWSMQFAQRYFSTVSAILQEAVPNHLRLSPRSETGGAEPDWLMEVVARACDIHNRPFGPEGPAGDAEGADGPVWIDGFAWTYPWMTGPTIDDAADDSALTRVEKMLAAGRSAFASMRDDPRVVAWTWPDATDGEWAQRDIKPRLVREDGSAAVEHTELLTWLNKRALKERMRRHAP